MSSPAPVLVTGATGFVGGLVLRGLLEQGRQVRALVRRQEDAGRLPAGAEPTVGSLEDQASLERAAAGAGVVYHLAGMNKLCLDDPAPLFEANVEGTRRLLTAARRSGVRRVVYTSSAAVLGGDGRAPVDERSDWQGPFVSRYAESKFQAERVAMAFDGVEVVAVSPSSVQGPGRRTGTAKLFLDYLNGKLPFVVPATFGLCYVDDCVAGHLLAEARGEPGERYVLNSGTLTAAEAIDLVGRLAGISRRPRQLPLGVAMAAARLAQTMARLRRTTTSLCPEAVRTLGHPHRYDGSRAERELGVRYTPLAEALARTVGWYVEQGLVTRPLPGLARSASSGDN